MSSVFSNLELERTEDAVRCRTDAREKHGDALLGWNVDEIGSDLVVLPLAPEALPVGRYVATQLQW